MNKQKSWGGSTKSTSLIFSGSPPRNQFKELDNKQVSFLLLKNKELQERTSRMGQFIVSLEKDKQQILKLNHRYVQTLNQQFKGSHGIFEEQMKKGRKNSHPLCKQCNKSILIEFQKDYRNLVRHCMTLQDQISSKNRDLLHYQQMKNKLSSVNHDSIGELVQEIADLTQELVLSKKENNRVMFENEKMKKQLEKMKKGNKFQKGEIQKMIMENENYKSLINTIQNQSIDAQHKLKQKIYDQEVVIAKLEQEVRCSQDQARKYRKKSEQIRVQQIQMISRSQSPGINLQLNQRKEIGKKKNVLILSC